LGERLSGGNSQTNRAQAVWRSFPFFTPGYAVFNPSPGKGACARDLDQRSRCCRSTRAGKITEKSGRWRGHRDEWLRGSHRARSTPFVRSTWQCASHQKLLYRSSLGDPSWSMNLVLPTANLVGDCVDGPSRHKIGQLRNPHRLACDTPRIFVLWKWAAADGRPYAAPKKQRSETESEYYFGQFQTPCAYWSRLAAVMTAAIPATTPTRRYKRRSQRRSSSRLIGGGTVLACSRKLGFLTQTWSEGLNGILAVLLHLRLPWTSGSTPLSVTDRCYGGWYFTLSLPASDSESILSGMSIILGATHWPLYQLGPASGPRFPV